MRADLAYMLLIVLVPILPAFALFRFLPSTADVGGPLKGLNVKIRGAFAGYIVGVLVSWQVATSLLEPTWADNWKVYGHVAFIDASSAHPAPPELVVMVRPPVPDIQSNGELQVTIPIARFHNGPEDIPRLVLSLNGYETVNVPLDSDHKHLAAYGGSDYQVIFDRKRHEIQIAKPIMMTQAPQ